jgi:hypothetical protein
MRRLAAARPGEPNWLPHVQPATPEEAVADLRHQLEPMLARGNPSDSPLRGDPGAQEFMARLSAEEVRWKVAAVAEWRAQRCNLVTGTTPGLLLLRAFAAEGSTELGRFVLDDKGSLVTFVFPHASGFVLADGHHLEGIASAEAAAAQALEGEPLEGPQYVAVASHTVPCPETNPCVAVRQGNQVALVRSGIVYRIDTSQRFSNRSFMLDDRARARVLDRAHPDDHVVSLGGDVLTVARRVR